MVFMKRLVRVLVFSVGVLVTSSTMEKTCEASSMEVLNDFPSTLMGYVGSEGRKIKTTRLSKNMAPPLLQDIYNYYGILHKQLDEWREQAVAFPMGDAVGVAQQMGPAIVLLEGLQFIPEEVGLGRAYFERFVYDTDTDSCKSFVWGGMDGNVNNFKSLEECEQVRQWYLTYQEYKKKFQESIETIDASNEKVLSAMIQALGAENTSAEKQE